MYIPGASIALGALALRDQATPHKVQLERRGESAKPSFKNKQDALSYVTNKASQTVIKHARGALNYKSNTGLDSVAFHSDWAQHLIQNLTHISQKRNDALGPLSEQGGYFTVSYNIGTPDQAVNLDIDSGSADLWVPQQVSKIQDFDISKSSTIKDVKRTFDIEYADGTGTHCEVYEDVVEFAGASSRLSFGVAKPGETAGLDGGLAGFAWSSLSSGQLPAIVPTMFSQGALDANMYAIDLASKTMELGGYDPAYNEKLVWHDISEKSFWGIQDVDLLHNGVGVINPSAYLYILDSGSTDITFPLELAFEFWSKIGVAVPVYMGSSFIPWIYPCSADLGDVELSFAGLKVRLEKEDLYEATYGDELCVGSIVGLKTSPSSSTYGGILGDTFLKKVYAVFDYENAKVGVAPLN